MSCTRVAATYSTDLRKRDSEALARLGAASVGELCAWSYSRVSTCSGESSVQASDSSTLTSTSRKWRRRYFGRSGSCRMKFSMTL
eukprot:scaffold284656_cov28-Tisochrysis_lutea.AAC.3